jgi:hypothetical protein
MYRVEWSRGALDRVTSAWMDGDSSLREAITHSVSEIDKRLAGDPANEGESRSAGRRVLFVPPLGVRFRVYSNTPIVVVLRAWLLPKDRSNGKHD